MKLRDLLVPVDGSQHAFTDMSDSATKILDHARDLDCDAIIMGHRGTGDFQGLLMGSVAHRVNHKAACRVITVKD